jgi:transposase
MTYHEIYRLKKEGNKVSQIVSRLGIDKRTVKKYLAMNDDQYLDSQNKLSQRAKKLLGYEDFVKERIERCMDASSAQVHDWLKECFPDFMEVSIKTVYNFVSYVREKYKLLREYEIRQFCKVPELPFGKQSQVDFGQYNMHTSENLRKKVYFMAMVLARSRQKFVFLQDQPFTANTAIEAHEKAFAFLGGYTQEVVYDQDKVLLADENKGNLILTAAFQSYQTHRGFKLHFCRKSDPQSKGKIENVIKYVKYNFLRGRIYYDNHTLNHQAIDWLGRTANAKVHATTQLIPHQEWLIEKTHLTHLSLPFLVYEGVDSYKVRKDNTISFRGNYYSLPIGTYQGDGSEVFVMQENGNLIIHNNDKQEIARHKISAIKGKLIFNTNHHRNTDLKIKELIELVSEKFSEKLIAIKYLEQVRDQNPRYVRDQIKMVHSACYKYYMHQRDAALNYCMENQIFKGSDFESVLIFLADQELAETRKEQKLLLEKEKYRVIPPKSNLSDYNQILN